MITEPTLHEALDAAGYVALPGARKEGARRIVSKETGELVGEMRAGEAWKWLRSKAEGYDECIACGCRFNATRRQKTPVCKECR